MPIHANPIRSSSSRSQAAKLRSPASPARSDASPKQTWTPEWPDWPRLSPPVGLLTGARPGPAKRRRKGATTSSRDRHERAADRLADRVVSGSPAGSPGTEPVLAAPDAPTTLPVSVAAVVRAPGRPLEAKTRQRMQAGCGQDLSAVRVHTDAAAASSAEALGALAYTAGTHIAFASGQYAPGESRGQHLIAHELAHVLQQRAGARPTVQLKAARKSSTAIDTPDTTEDTSEDTTEDTTKDQWAGTPVSQIIISLARERVGFRTSVGMLLGDVETDLKPGRYLLTPDTRKRRWVITSGTSVKAGLRFDVTLDEADPWTLAYPATLPLLVTSGDANADKKTFGQMLDRQGQLVDPLWLYEDWPEAEKPRPIAGVDDFESVYYDLDHRSDKHDLSKWLMVHYRDGSEKDINLDSVTEATPRLWAARRDVLKIMDDYNTMFILHTFPAVFFILTMNASVERPGGQTRYQVSRQTVAKSRAAKQATPPEGAPELGPRTTPETPAPPRLYGSPDDGYGSAGIFRKWVEHDLPDEGWKLHVSADARSASQVSDTVLPLLRQWKVNHKVVGTVDQLTGMSPGQQGKFITIYPDNTVQAKAIANVIDGELAGKGLTGPRVAGERQLGSSGLVSTRYGGFTKLTVRDPTGAEVKDVRGQVKPDWVADPWQPQATVRKVASPPTVGPGPGAAAAGVAAGKASRGPVDEE